MAENLLPCPFCGCKAILCSTGNHFATEKFFVSCGVCGVETPRIARTRKEAIAAWNRRADHLPDATKKVSNADRIRGMSDGELARFLARVENRRSAAGNGAMWNGMANALDWLKQPAKEELI